MTFTTVLIIVGVLTILCGLFLGVQQYLYIRWHLQEKRPLNYFKCDKFSDVASILFWGWMVIIHAIGGNWFLFVGSIIFFLVYVARYEFFTRFAPKVNNVD